MENWQLLNSTTLLKNRWITLRVDECRTARGVHIDQYYVVEKDDFAMAVALTPPGEVILVRQYKHPAAGVIVECPAGYLAPGEDPAAAVVRELREETGYRAPTAEFIGAWFTSPGVLTTRGHIFLCRDVVLEGPQELDHSEDIEVVVVDFDRAVRELTEGKIISDLASASALLLARQKLGLGQSRRH